MRTATRPRRRRRPAPPVPARRQASFAFTPAARQQLVAVSAQLGVSQNAVLELAIRHLAGRVGRGHDRRPAERSADERAGSVISYRLSADGLRLLAALVERQPRAWGAQVAVAELAIRRFAERAEREFPADPL